MNRARPPRGWLRPVCALVLVLAVPGRGGETLVAPRPAASGDLAPAAAVQEFMDLVHAGQNAAARAAVIELLATYPRDPRLARAKELVENALTAEKKPPAAGHSAPAHAPLTAAEAAAYQQLVKLGQDAKRAGNSARQKDLLRQFLAESEPLLAAHPDLMLLWEIRAAAALVLDDPLPGYVAGQQLRAHGAAGSKNANQLRLLALLQEKGWDNEQQVRQAMVAATYTFGQPHTTKLADEISMDFVWIPPGAFTMGSPATEQGRSYNEGPQTPVTISQGFWLGKTPVTQAQYQALIGDSPNYYKEAGPDSPVSHMEWADAREYCRRLTVRESAAGRLPAGYVYCLPSEAEWEYACRAGTTGPRYGDDLDAIAWHSANNRSGVVQPVAQKLPNAWGLYDLYGGGWEWCSDWYGPYPGIPVIDPMGPPSGKGRICRGTYPYDDADRCRSARRNWSDHAYAYSSFRVAICVARPGR